MTITLTREEAQQVLDALEKVTKQMLSARDELGERGGRPVTNTHHQKIWDRASEAYTDQAIPAAETLRARLSAFEPEKKKYTEESCPVCGYYCLGKGGVKCIDKPKLCGINTTPPQREWQGLTDEERTYLAWESNNGPHCVAMTEAKLKEKNT